MDWAEVCDGLQDSHVEEGKNQNPNQTKGSLLNKAKPYGLLLPAHKMDIQLPLCFGKG